MVGGTEWMSKLIPHNSSLIPLKVSVFLPVFHGGFRQAVVQPGGAAFADFGIDNFLDNVVYSDGGTLYGSGAGGIADSAEAYFAVRSSSSGSRLRCSVMASNWPPGVITQSRECEK